jgi:hypothetical protein
VRGSNRRALGRKTNFVRRDAMCPGREKGYDSWMGLLLDFSWNLAKSIYGQIRRSCEGKLV